MPLAPRRETIPVQVGKLVIGGGAPISVQSMTNTRTEDLEATLQQIRTLAEQGCELVRVAVPDLKAAANLADLVRESPIPLVADIHYDPGLALAALRAGVPKIRINPGNIGGRDKLREIVAEAARRGAAIRIGVNAGSLERRAAREHGPGTPQALVESALGYLDYLEKLNFRQVVLSLKASDVVTTIQAYRLAARRVPYPFHVGITEAGPPPEGIVKAAVGIGTLLAEGIGDTLRVSLTADPGEEVRVGRQILQALRLRTFGPELISCPTCGRCEAELIPLVREVAAAVEKFPYPIKIAVMGCSVNGPGEAREADLGITAGRKQGLLFRRGKVIRTVPRERLLAALLEELERYREAGDFDPGSEPSC
ncbi:MAG TPA: flavodoxin-dependent (E)-4-hydroxy-3-methylbut-2-enyl-diphosphate synthase [Bacillota bacterium]|jgi:(E)-4-hydroxy-3-methylbut-2-enyl-diphosphate synthase|nr:flavodoxin-dependent (E)-4-hydroxy-3-methylbut-2-enyl-diphosphate synthase [Bacillota bacterium]HOP68444.1 flavodoxin-dependent (E)-4-hydroxy-3-methylbut-2-enyl-diphosphate synthase [Bacillota bacterium]HPT33550.1 flavodoxin-dependent (E)-4-hydroxy-3-methylbut-2-enyl-diphosphate synthase [Bacillota bacterium]HQD05818.1 flavodoxin-dependent (E)-4-hydroxy-3-methylbut-2-enyl-diphosphate synthase [Bacillota bacterium]